MKKKSIFIGVDGGATKLLLRMEDQAGNVLAVTKSGPANIRLSVESAWQSIQYALKEACDIATLSLNDPNILFHAGFGLAGCEKKSACNIFLNQPHSFSTLQLFSDAKAACIGAHQHQNGAIIIIGTGAVGYQIVSGKNNQVGGWGFPHDDEGSGAWIGLEATRLTFQAIDKRHLATPLTKKIFSHFEEDTEKLLEWASSASPTQFASLVPLVIETIQQQDISALTLIKKSASAIDKISDALEIQAGKNLPCCLLGGIAPFIEPFLGKKLRSRLIPAKTDPASGAILLIRNIVS